MMKLHESGRNHITADSSTDLDLLEPCRICGCPEIDHNRPPYHAHVHSLCRRWRNLQHLDNYMNQPFHRNLPKGQPNPRVAVFDVSSTVGLAFRNEFTHVHALSNFLDGERENGPPTLRIFVIQDLFPDLIEFMGANFDVDPAFFSSHIYDLDWFSKTPSAATVSPGKTNLQQLRFRQFRYLEARPLKIIGNVLDSERVACWDSYLLRHVNIMKSCSTRHGMGFSRSQLTVWSSPRDAEHSVGM
jgi:hypothetical protein